MPTPLVLETPELQSNEVFKSFPDQDSLAKGYLELKTRTDSGDIGLLSEELRKDPTIAKFKTVGDVAKSYVEAQKLLGTIKHAPSKVEEYRFTSLKDLHPGVSKGVESTQKFLAQLFHANDIDNDRADKIQQAVVMGLNQALIKQDEERSVKSKEVETALRSDWKENYDKNKANVENIFKRIGLESYGKEISSDPIKLKALHRLTSLLSEDSIGKLGEETNTSADLKTTEGRMKALKEFNDEVIKLGASHPFNDAKHKDHAATVAKYNSFFQEQTS